MPEIDELTYLTADLPGTGGTLKQRPEDFLVDEQPLYEPCGEGEHLYLFIEKKQATTQDLIRRVAKAFRVKRSDVGYAGQKDKHAVTRQHLSIYRPGTSAEEDHECLERFKEYPYAQVIWADRHTNKLRRGHHGGNRFVIKLREVDPTAVIKAKPILERLAAEGFPNYLGEQRFGYRNNSHLLGKHLLRGEWQAFLDEMLGKPLPTESDAVQQARTAYEAGDYDLALEHMPKSLRGDRQALDALRQHKTPEKAVNMIDRTQRDFLVTAAQSAIFNAVIDRRLRDGTLSKLLPGDLAWKHDNRSCFTVDAETAELENGPDGRVASLEVSPSGPFWGPGMTQTTGDVLAAERAALEDMGMAEDDFANQRHLSTDGTRRPLRERLLDPEYSSGVDEHGPYLRLAFTLGRGAFATMVVREITKGVGR
ncbi:tRNA pseudouridine(13) synthase TruD [Algisphaera agarilytica]|uniref:tRNA pseudouridine synthase D n=1 Tax=Algisphaera agarilytica TaxID=1385975 RepID=A0A7X0H7M8_9BACT|nr:tRNA pseudouridine(13) synthase TruD [Algisphaera agarilytica]MBB6429310.1 tRNA pseudouridine13 synthase [Algisphaera agarilytica]